MTDIGTLVHKDPTIIAGGTVAKGEVRGTGKVCEMPILNFDIHIDVLDFSREDQEKLKDRMQEFHARSVLEWRKLLSKEDHNQLLRLTKKSTNIKRISVLTNTDCLVLSEYFKLIGLSDFPKKLYTYAVLTNASIKSILRAL